MRSEMVAAVLTVLVSMVATPASARQEIAASTASSTAQPSLSGVWMLSRSQHPFDPQLVSKLPADTVVLDDTGAAEFPAGEYGGLEPTAAALAAAAEWKPEDDMSVSRACARPSVVYATQGPFPFEIVQGTDLLVFRYEYFDLVRIIYMDGRAHPPADAPHSVLGHSIGHWERDELVVDTTHVDTGTITNNGLNHSDKIHVIERFKLSPDGRTLKSTMWFEDPEVLENNGARYIQWTLQPGEYIYPYECDPSFGANYTNAR